MQAASDRAALAAPATPSAPAPSAGSPVPAESVERPSPGLASGRWEAPAWVFYAVAALAALGGLVWLMLALRTRRSGVAR
jgi:hypothetical protein